MHGEDKGHSTTGETPRIPLRGLPVAGPVTVTPDPRTIGRIAKGRSGGRLPGSGDAAVKMFFPEEDEDVEMNPHVSLPDSSATGRSRWVTLSGAPSRLDAQQILPRNAESQIPASPSQGAYGHEEDVKVGGLTEPCSAPPPQSPKLSQRDADPAVTAIHTLQESVSHPVRIKEELYKIVSQVGEGTFGKVYKAQNTVSRTFVALKRIRMEGERDGFPVTAMREIKLLQSIRHPNVVNLHEMMVSKGESDSE